MDYSLTVIKAEDDVSICQIIKSVGVEFGAVGDGFGPSDAEVLNMSQYYSPNDKSLYLVARLSGQIVGGGGIAPFNGDLDVCELKKLFLLPQGRGLGIGRAIAEECLKFARTQGFSSCYLDTLSHMKSAVNLYEALGFEHLTAPFNGTEHNGCDVWMSKSL